MEFYVFSDTLCDRNISYSYTKRGTSEFYHPDKKRERMNGLESYDKTNGNLFYGFEVAWKGEKLLDRSIDINVNLDGRVFVDHIFIKQSEGSRPGSVEVLTRELDELKKIAVYANGSHITEEEITVPVGYYCDNIVVRLNGNYEPIGIRKFDILGSTELEHTVYPMLNNLTEKGGSLPFDKIAGISCDCAEAQNAVTYLQERFRDKCGASIGEQLTQAFEDIKEVPVIRMCFIEREDDGFDIEIDENGCRIQAGCKRGFIYAVDVLVQLAEEKGLKMCSISEKPVHGFRGIHIALPFRAEIPFLKKFIREAAVPMRYNTVIIEVCAAMRYDNFPEINEAWLTAIDNYEKGLWPHPAHYGLVGGDILEKSEVRELCAYIRSFGLEIIPEIQSLSHAQYLTTAYPFLAEGRYKVMQTEATDLYMADTTPPPFYPHSMCPLHEDYYKYVLGVAEEVIETIQPERYVHMGHDEGYYFGECEKCCQEIPGKLFAEEVTKLNDYIKSKNLTMMIWSDMLQSEYFYDKCYSTPEAINWLPKDIVLLDFTWYFHPELDLEDKLVEKGFQVGFGNLYSSHFPRYEYRSRKKGIIGGQISMWVRCKEEIYAYEGKMYDMLYTANMLWNEGYDSAYRLTYNEIIKPLLWNVRCKIGDIKVQGETKRIEFEGSMRNIPNELLWNVPYEKAGVLSQSQPELIVNVENTADTVLVTHATDLSVDRIMWQPSVQVGEYCMVYEDGTVDSTGLYYSENIHKYAQTYGKPIDSILFRHQGYTGTYSARPICGKDCNGKDYTLLEMPIPNKYPEKKIDRILMKHMQNTDAKIFVFDVKLIKA